MIDPFRGAGAPKARSACVVVGVEPEEVAAVHVAEDLAIRKNRHGTLVIGRLASLPLDYAERFDGPVYDVMYNPRTGWFSVTIFDGMKPPRRFEPGATGETCGGYARAADILGATDARSILAALDVPPDLIA